MIIWDVLKVECWKKFYCFVAESVLRADIGGDQLGLFEWLACG